MATILSCVQVLHVNCEAMFTTDVQDLQQDQCWGNFYKHLPSTIVYYIFFIFQKKLLGKIRNKLHVKFTFPN